MMTWENRWHPLLERWVTVTSHRGSAPGRVVALQRRLTHPGLIRPAICARAVNGYPVLKTPFIPTASFLITIIPPLKRARPRQCQRPGSIKAPVRKACVGSCVTPQIMRGRLSGLSEDQFKDVVHCWRDQTDGLMTNAGYEHVFIFENNGEVVGVSNPHPHCQIYATPFVFHTVTQEIQAIARYRQADADNLFDAIIRSEQADGRRILVETDDCLAFVPYFAQLPYETFIVPKGSWQRLPEMPASVLDDLALVLRCGA